MNDYLTLISTQNAADTLASIVARERRAIQGVRLLLNGDNKESRPFFNTLSVILFPSMVKQSNDGVSVAQHWYMQLEETTQYDNNVAVLCSPPMTVRCGVIFSKNFNYYRRAINAFAKRFRHRDDSCVQDCA